MALLCKDIHADITCSSWMLLKCLVLSVMQMNEDRAIKNNKHGQDIQ